MAQITPIPNSAAPFKTCHKINHPYDRKNIVALEEVQKGSTAFGISDVQQYLRQYGYLASNTACDAGTLDEPTSSALAHFQKNFTIDSTAVGDFDAATREQMIAPRCGLPDVANSLDFNTAGPWGHRNLSYTFGNLSSRLPFLTVRNAMRRALDTWAAAGVGLTFHEVLPNANPDIFIEWRPANDPDHSMVGGILAHADFPPGFSIIVTQPPLPLHFDDQEHAWVDGAVANGFDVETVGLHELGHCLGLFHTTVPGSVMFPSVSSNKTARRLQPDDQAGIESLYSSDASLFTKVYQEGDPGKGIGGYDLKSSRDRVFALDFDHSSKTDHLCLYRPGTGTMWILKQQDGKFAPVFAQGDPGKGIGGYDLLSPADRAFAFDYDHSGKLDHVCLYRPGTGTLWILKNEGGSFAAVFAEGDPGKGIGGYDLRSPEDRVFAFDFDHSGKQDHLCLYRPGTGTFWILKHDGGIFQAVFAQGDPGNGIGGYDLKSHDDRAFAFDFDQSGRLDHVVLYRPGTGTLWILKNNAGSFAPTFAEGDPGRGVGGYDLKSRADQAFAFDFNGTGKLDHLALYRPGTGTIWILHNQGGNFEAVYRQGDPGRGIGGYDLRSPADTIIAFDYGSAGLQDYLVLTRPGTGTIWIMKKK